MNAMRTVFAHPAGSGPLRTPSIVRAMLVPALVLSVAGACRGAPEAPAEIATEPGVVELDEAQRIRAGIVVEAVTASDGAVPVEVPAEVAPPDTARAVLGSIVEGRVEAVHVLPGDEVATGDVLVSIHSHEMVDAQRDRDQAQAELAYAEAALERSGRLLAAGAVSREEVERRTADRDAARAELHRASEMVAHLDPSSDGDVTVRAPRPGVVLAVHVDPSAAVVPGQPLVEVGALRPLWATAHVPEEHAARLAVGDDARVIFPAQPGEPVAARLVRVGAQIDALTRTLEVRVELGDPPAGIRPGMFARVELVEGERRRGLRLPGDAVQQVDGVASVFVEEGVGRYRAVAVEVVPLPGGDLFVVGLGDGARVVVVGAPFLKAATEQGGLAADEG